MQSSATVTGALQVAKAPRDNQPSFVTSHMTQRQDEIPNRPGKTSHPAGFAKIAYDELSYLFHFLHKACSKNNKKYLV